MTRTDLKVVVSGLLGWSVLTVGMLKLSVLFTEHKVVTYLIIYNVVGTLFLLYFYAYFRARQSFLKSLLLIALFNLSVQSIHHLHEVLFQLSPWPLSSKLGILLVPIVLNLAFLIIVDLIVIRWLKFGKG